MIVEYKIENEAKGEVQIVGFGRGTVDQLGIRGVC